MPMARRERPIALGHRPKGLEHRLRRHRLIGFQYRRVDLDAHDHHTAAREYGRERILNDLEH